MGQLAPSDRPLTCWAGTVAHPRSTGEGAGQALDRTRELGHTGPRGGGAWTGKGWQAGMRGQRGCVSGHISACDLPINCLGKGLSRHPATWEKDRDGQQCRFRSLAGERPQKSSEGGSGLSCGKYVRCTVLCICASVRRVPRCHPLVISSGPCEQPRRRAGTQQCLALPQRTP